MTLYRIYASLHGQADYDYAVLGEAYGARYATEAEAEAVAAELRRTVRQYDLHPDTKYRVEIDYTAGDPRVTIQVRRGDDGDALREVVRAALPEIPADAIQLDDTGATRDMSTDGLTDVQIQRAWRALIDAR